MAGILRRAKGGKRAEGRRRSLRDSSPTANWGEITSRFIMKKLFGALRCDPFRALCQEVKIIQAAGYSSCLSSRCREAQGRSKSSRITQRGKLMVSWNCPMSSSVSWWADNLIRGCWPLSLMKTSPRVVQTFDPSLDCQIQYDTWPSASYQSTVSIHLLHLIPFFLSSWCHASRVTRKILRDR